MQVLESSRNAGFKAGQGQNSGGALMCRRPGWRLRKVATIRKHLGVVAGDLGKGTELRHRQGREDYLRPLPGNPDLGALEAEGLGQADRLAPTMLKDLRRRHIYIM